MSPPPPTPRQIRILWLALTGLAIAVICGLIAGLVWGLGQVLQILSPVLWPLAVAGVLAYLLDPVVDFFERKGLSRARSILLAFAIVLLILAGVFGSVVPSIVRQTRQLVERIPEIARTVETKIETWANKPPAWIQRFLPDKEITPESQTPGAGTNTVPSDDAVSSTNAAPSAAGTNQPAGVTSAAPGPGVALDKQTLQTAGGWLATTLPKVGKWLFGQVGRVASWFGVLVGLALVPIYLFYLLLEKRGIESTWTTYLPLADSHLKDEIVFVIRQINNYLIAFFRGQVLVAICDGILYAIGFLIIGLPYAVVLGAAAIILTMVPFLGAIVTCVVALILAFAQHGDWLHPALVLVVFAVVQTLEGFVISPKIMGDRVGLHPLTIIIAVMVGTTLFGGLLGGILAIPLTAVLRVLMARYVWTKRESST